MENLKFKQALEDDEISPLVLDFILLDKFDIDYYSWEHETLWIEIFKEFGVALSATNKGKIQAIRLCRYQDSPYKKWEIFENIGTAFCNAIPAFGVLQPLNPYQCIKTVNLLLKFNTFEISDEVYRYIAACMLEDSFLYAPSLISRANNFLVKFSGKLFQATMQDLISSNKLFGPDESFTIQLAKVKSLDEYKNIDQEIANKQLRDLK